MPKIQPHREIGPNNAGKMIIRGICFAGIQGHPEALAVIQDYLSARGTVSSISLSEPLSEGMTKDEADFVVQLIGKFKEKEFTAPQLPNVKAADTARQQDEIVALAGEELGKFLAAQHAAGKEVTITLPMETIIGNVEARQAVSYVQTLTWEDTEPDIADEGDYEPPAYVPPAYVPIADDADREERASSFGLQFHSMFSTHESAARAEEAIRHLLDDDENKKEEREKEAVDAGHDAKATSRRPST